VKFEIRDSRWWSDRHAAAAVLGKHLLKIKTQNSTKTPNGPSVDSIVDIQRTMSSITVKEKDDNDNDVTPDAKEEGDVNKPEENKEITPETEDKVVAGVDDAKDKEKEDKETEETGDRHVVLTSSRRIRNFSVIAKLTRQGQEP
jgi:hypothetical protein